MSLARCLIGVLLLAAIPATAAGAQAPDPHTGAQAPDPHTGAQAPDPHSGHAMPGMAANAAPTMDHSSMDHSSMNHGSMPMQAGKMADPMAGMDHGAMGSMVMPDGSVMQMVAVPKALVRRHIGPAEAALQGFTDAIEVGNQALAMARLAPGLVVTENGSDDDYAGYVGSHLASDMAFGKTVKTVLLSRQVQLDSRNRVVITSTSRMISNRSDRRVDLDSAETATIIRIGDDWKISRLVWTSAPHSDR
jgi:hypothetical protein